MKKFKLKSDNREIKIGDVLIKCTEEDSPFGKICKMQKVLINEEMLHLLIKKGIIIQEDSNFEDIQVNIPMKLNYYIIKILKKLNCTTKESAKIIVNLIKIYPFSMASMILREIAIELDKSYKDHIRDSSEIYIISTLDGKIKKIPKAHIKNYRNFAAFRSVEDARVACRIIKPLLKNMFKDDNKKQ